MTPEPPKPKIKMRGKCKGFIDDACIWEEDDELECDCYDNGNCPFFMNDPGNGTICAGCMDSVIGDREMEVR